MFPSCVYVDCDDGFAEVADIKVRQARKTYRCCECQAEILPGTRYEHAKLLFAGTWDVYRTCLTCVRIRDSLFRSSWYYGEIWDYIHEQYCLGDRREEESFCICPDTIRSDPC